jgi:hypothetical protein
MGLIKKGIRLPLTWMDKKFEESLETSLIEAAIIANK